MLAASDHRVILVGQGDSARGVLVSVMVMVLVCVVEGSGGVAAAL